MRVVGYSPTSNRSVSEIFGGFQHSLRRREIGANRLDPRELPFQCAGHRHSVLHAGSRAPGD
jgi:hypothetical protein